MDINSLKKAELIEYAESLGAEIGARDTVDEIKEKIAAASGSTIEPTGEQLDQQLAKAKSDPEDELKVIFHPGPNDDTSNVYFSINGKAMSLPRNEEVTVKRKYLDMLTNECVGFTLQQKTNRQTGEVETKQIKKPTYTFDIVG